MIAMETRTQSVCFALMARIETGEGTLSTSVVRYLPIINASGGGEYPENAHVYA